MSLLYRDANGNETHIAGLDGAAQLVPSVTYYQTGSINMAVTMPDGLPAGDFFSYDVVFTNPMPDTDYVVSAEFENAGGNRTWGLITVMYKTTTGFRLFVRNADFKDKITLTSSELILWKAFKLVTTDIVASNEAAIANLQNSKQNALPINYYASGNFNKPAGTYLSGTDDIHFFDFTPTENGIYTIRATGYFTPNTQAYILFGVKNESYQQQLVPPTGLWLEFETTIVIPANVTVSIVSNDYSSKTVTWAIANSNYKIIRVR
jgi:hypothetical protein